MFDAGVGLAQALSQLAKDFDSQEWREACQRMLRGIETGHRLDRSMANFPHLFSDFHRQLVAVGFETGKLSAVLRAVADLEQSLLESRGKVWSALAYPLFTMGLCFLATILGPPLLLSNLFDMFRSQGVELPILTECIIFFSDLCLSPYFHLLLLLTTTLIVVAFRKSYRSEKGREFIFTLLHAIPFIGPMLKELEISRFSSAMALTLEAGLPILRGLKLAQRLSSNPSFQKSVEQVIQALTQGESFTEAVRSRRLLPPIYTSYLEAGEEAGTLSQSLSQVDQEARREFDYRVELFQNALEPVSILFVGVVVGTFVLGALLPMSRLLQTL